MSNQHTTQSKTPETCKETTTPISLKIRVTPATSEKTVLQLQRSLGKQTVQRLLNAGVIQAKLKIGLPGDKYEQEADRLARSILLSGKKIRSVTSDSRNEEASPKIIKFLFSKSKVL